ncbi:LytTR family DNA-binding domain-containing protein [Spongiimicrobium salis]|uniref:LytTR family DNA-binding domain-containing protein n=1 Tax=Spongiimicrobium salis TaxID=1667022 RepID=UPI00374DBD7C
MKFLQKKYLLIALLIFVFALGYTLMIAVLFAQDSDSIYYYKDSSLFMGLFGIIGVIIAHQIDSKINSLNVQFVKRIYIVQFVISLASTLFLLFLISWLINGLTHKTWTLNFTFLKEQMLLVNFELIIVLAYLTISYFTKAVTKQNKSLRHENNEMSIALNRYLQRVSSTSNKKTTIIPTSKVSYFKMDEGVIFACKNEKVKYPLSITTLNTLEEQLNPSLFFRINRSEIININVIQGYEPYFKDRLAITLIDIHTPFYTSNARSSAFKDWVVRPL